MNNNKNTSIHASETAHGNFPILERLGEFAHNDVQTIIILTPKDLLKGQSPEEVETIQARMDIERQFRNKKITKPEYNDEIRKSYVDPAMLAYETFQRLFPDKYDILKEEINFTTLGHRLLGGDASARTIDMDITAKDSYVLIITSPYADATKEELASKVSMVLSPKNLKNVPGTDENWRNSDLIHEVNHGLDKSAIGLSQEIEADIGVINKLPLTFNAKVNNSHLVPEYEQAMRAIASFNDPNIADSHITNAAIKTDGEGIPPNGTEVSFVNQLIHTKSKTFINSIETDELLYVNSARTVLNMHQLGDGGIMNEDDRFKLNEIIKNPNDPENFDRINNLSQDIQNILYATAYKEHAYLGERQALLDMPNFYKTTHKLYIEGDYDKKPIGKQYAYEFLVAANKYVSDIYETEGFDQSAIIQPLFDNNGQHISTPAEDNTKVDTIKTSM